MTLREILVAVAAGIVQGFVEWLPISSSGNLSLFLTALGTSPDIAVRLALFLQMGTTLSAALYYRETILDAIASAPGWRPRSAFAGSNAEPSFVLVATAMTGLVGIPIYVALIDLASELTGGAFVALIGGLLVVTGLVERASEDVSLGERGTPSLVDAIIVGAFQGMTILPGVSRSGTTASVLLFRGYEGPAAFRLSFLLSIPAGIGAGVLILVDEGLPTTGLEAVIALVISAIVGYAMIDAIMRVVHKVDFWIVCVALGGLAVLGGGLTMVI
ncbi:undecaprenyl-diphosphate phosphatase [Halalkalicoccus jeotgali]|uniref:Undecaprenyl-diphosphatase n=1 Tax=Halalkalicoccus jeotgali (strain DSM 18796 / CECT 7217 / JCM 14584 / KCTC 4019 / B3) TaxID=795797 RepID=D8J2Y0_HALJB|nr:undecaprenyl-diphosphate phosphatase [Halalkalicoccus jeotgali]ADJ15087.1 bacitracin resistance protein [Halalkalicoccus jeotgali B3]ELY34894.1 bacitracin resistance protein [Halalkalicoccus jeotgali B3]